MLSEPARILAFDTSAAHCAAVLLADDRCAARCFEAMARGQAERLMPMLGELLAKSGCDWGDLDAVAVGTGPGNFTGLRLSAAAARGIALARGIPALGVTAFEALAAQSGATGPVLVVLENRRGAEFCQAFHVDAEGNPEALGAPGAGFDHLPELPNGTLCLGHQAAEVAVTLGFAAGSTQTVPDPMAIARIAARRIGDTTPAPAPLYLRAADAAPSRDAAPVLIDDT